MRKINNCVRFQRLVKKRLLKFSFIIAAILGCLFSTVVATAQNSNALHFDGANDLVSIPDNTVFDLDSQEQFTIEFWLYRPLGSASGLHHIMGKRVACGADINWQIVLDDDGPLNGNLAFGWGGPGNLSIARNPSIPLGQLTHISITCDGSLLKLYVAGNLENSVTVTSNVGPANNAPLVIGASGTCPDGINATLDELRFWDHALTQQEILANMNCHLNGNEPGLVAYYDFNQGIAGGNNAGLTTLPDLTSHGLNGTLQNFALLGNTSNWVASEFTDLPVSITRQPSDTLIGVGNSAGFFVSSTNNPVSFQWQTDSAGSGFHNIFDGGRYIGTSNDTLLVNSVTLDNNSQLLRCVVSSPGFCSDTSLAALIKIQYIFNGIGDWNINTNWLNNTIPPDTLPANSEIIINPTGDSECILNITQTILPGAKISIKSGKKFRVISHLIIQ